MEVLINFACVLTLFLNTVSFADGNCLLSLNKDFGHPSPVYIQDGVFLAPNSGKGDVALRRDSVVLVGCPGVRRHVILGNTSQDYDAVEAHCVSNTTFKVGQWVGHFRDIRCNIHPWFTSEEIGKCYAGNEMYRVGYVVQKKFYELYEVCFDKNLFATLYVKHQVSPASVFTQNIGSRPQFVEGNLFNKVRMSELYKTKNQKVRLNELLGADLDHLYITKNQFITRGHLAPRADFPMLAPQRASFHYANAAPQWMRGNAGGWAALETGLRQRVAAVNATVTVYTGAYGVSTLPNKDGRPTDLYLGTDANNNNVVPVPKYFYKLVYDPAKRTATAFVLQNSAEPRVSADAACAAGACAWLRWRGGFCCTYGQLADQVPQLPTLAVHGVF